MKQQLSLRKNLSKRFVTRRGIALAGALSLVAGGLLAAPQAGASVPTTDDPPTYDAYQAIVDPGTSDSSYFQPYWYDNNGRHIQAHGGQAVKTAEELGIDSNEVMSAGLHHYYWFGEDRSNGYGNSPGVHVYSSDDSYNWIDEGLALRAATGQEEIKTDSYFTNLYGDNGIVSDETASKIYTYLGTTKDSVTGNQAIIERPKVIYNQKTHQWVMWWHSDGNVTANGGTYDRSLAAVATSESPTGPYKMIGAYRMPNRSNYTACQAAVPGQARDMTVFKDSEGTAYLSYSSENNASLYFAKLNDDYTNVIKTTDSDQIAGELNDVNGGSTILDTGFMQYSESGKYPYILDDGTSDSPQRGTDYQIVRECGNLEAPIVFQHGGRYYALASGATGWAPNPQTYYTADSIMGSWIRGIEPDDPYENIKYDSIPEGGDGLLSVGDFRKTTFGSQGSGVLDLGEGRFVYLADRWNGGDATSTYVWLPMTFAEDGRLSMTNPSTESSDKWGQGWDQTYWEDKGAGEGIWSVDDSTIPTQAKRGETVDLPQTVNVTVANATAPVAVTWNTTKFDELGAQTLIGTLSADNSFSEGRTFTRTIDITMPGLRNIATEATTHASSRDDLSAKTVDGDDSASAWNDLDGYGNAPKDSWLSYTWDHPLILDSARIVTIRESSEVKTWPDSVGVQYLDGEGNWKNTDIVANVDADESEPTIALDLTSVPATQAVRFDLHRTADDGWSAVSEVSIFGYSSSDATDLASLQVNGESVSGFDPAQWNSIYHGQTGSVMATAKTDGATVQVSQPTADNPFAYVVVTSPDRASKSVYRIEFVTDSTDATLDMLLVNGNTVANFDPAVYSYAVDVGVWGSSPRVQALATGRQVATHANADVDGAEITVTSQDGNHERTYQIALNGTREGCTTESSQWEVAIWGDQPASVCIGDQGSFSITDQNSGVWSDHDNLTVVYMPDKLPMGGSFETYLDSASTGANGDPRAGIVVRDDLSKEGQGSATGYYSFTSSLTGAFDQWDSDGNGYIDSERSPKVGIGVWPAYMKIERQLIDGQDKIVSYVKKGASDEWVRYAEKSLNGSDPDKPLDVGVFGVANQKNGDPATYEFRQTRVSSINPVTDVTAAQAHLSTDGDLKLPESVQVTHMDGSTQGASVRWDAIPDDWLTQKGTIVDTGTAEDTDIPAFVTARVSATSKQSVSEEDKQSGQQGTQQSNVGLADTGSVFIVPLIIAIVLLILGIMIGRLRRIG